MHDRNRSARAWIGVLIGVLAIGFLVAWHKSIRHHIHPRNFGVVEEGRVYRSGRLTPAAIEKLRDRYNIRTIVDLRDDPVGSRNDRLEQATADALGIERIRLGLVGDGTGDPNQYVEALRIMNDPERQPVLVHCAAGAQRTGGCVVFYRVVNDDESIEEAYKETSAFGHDPSDNPNLRPYIEQWAAEIERALRTGEPIESGEQAAGGDAGNAPSD